MTTQFNEIAEELISVTICFARPHHDRAYQSRYSRFVRLSKRRKAAAQFSFHHTHW